MQIINLPHRVVDPCTVLVREDHCIGDLPKNIETRSMEFALQLLHISVITYFQKYSADKHCQNNNIILK